MSGPVPLFVELCAGLASVSGVLEHGSTWKPPVSRMGRKTGYAGAILRVMGLRPRQKAERYLWAEADGDVAELLAAYTQPEVMREIASIIRSWIPCPYGDHPPDPSCSRCKGTGRWDARDLWEVLRREKRRGLWGGEARAQDVATWLAAGKSSYRQGDPESCGYTAREDLEWLARHCSALPWPPVFIAHDAAVDVGSVAGWIYAWEGSFSRKGPDAGIGHPEGKAATDTVGAYRPIIDVILDNPGLRPHVWPPTALTPSASISPPPLPVGTVCYIDPPYLNTTGYKHDLSRDQVIKIAQNWKSGGARVYISEAEPIKIEGWHHVEISGERKGQARTFGATREWLTCSHPPAWTPSLQGWMFG